MQRITVTIDDELLAAIDRVITERGYQNRSEAIRDLARAGMTRATDEASAGHAGVAALVYVYDHGSRELPKRLTHAFHDHHDLSLATMHVHLDHESCLEVAVLRGELSAIRQFADRLISERGVRHGRLVAIPVELAAEAHSHGGRSNGQHLHTHVRDAG